MLTVDESCRRCGASLTREETSVPENQVEPAPRSLRISWFSFCAAVALFPLAIAVLGASLSFLANCSGGAATLCQRTPQLLHLVQGLASMAFLSFWTVPTGVILFVVGSLLRQKPR